MVHALWWLLKLFIMYNAMPYTQEWDTLYIGLYIVYPFKLYEYFTVIKLLFLNSVLLFIIPSIIQVILNRIYLQI